MRKRVGPVMVTVCVPEGALPRRAGTAGVAVRRTGPLVSQSRVTSSPGQATEGVAVNRWICGLGRQPLDSVASSMHTRSPNGRFWSRLRGTCLDAALIPLPGRAGTARALLRE